MNPPTDVSELSSPSNRRFPSKSCTPNKDLIPHDPTRPDLTVSHPCSSTIKPQEAKKEARIEREEFAVTGGNKKLTKKERKRLEQAEFE